MNETASVTFFLIGANMADTLSIKSQVLLDLMRSAFDEGWYGYFDSKESVIRALLDKHKITIKETIPKAVVPKANELRAPSQKANELSWAVPSHNEEPPSPDEWGDEELSACEEWDDDDDEDEDDDDD